VEGALLAAGFEVFDARPASGACDEASPMDDTGELVDADVAVAVGDDLQGVLWARDHGLPCVLVRHGRPEPGDLVEAVMTGADSVITSDASLEELLGAVRAVIGGELALSARDARCVVERLRADLWTTRPRIELTPRQQAVLDLIVTGVSVKQTARTLGIAVKTVENTQSRLYRRLGVRNRAQAVAVAIAEGLATVQLPDSAGELGAKSPKQREG
jgi:DNA-binding NarL/FixJ family response regulator